MYKGRFCLREATASASTFQIADTTVPVDSCKKQSASEKDGTTKMIRVEVPDERTKVFVVGLSLLLLVVTLMFSTSLAGTVYVPADQPTIQAGIDASSNGDTVLVAPGTYAGPGNRDVMINGRTIAILSEAGAEFTIIDVQASPANPARGVDVRNLSSVLIKGFTFQNGYIAGYQHGAGVKIQFAPATIEDCIFRDNVVEGVGGAVFANSGGGSASTVVIRRCLFETNSALIGGAIQSYTRDIFIEDCEFIGNSAIESGGAMSLANDGHVLRCRFRENSVGNTSVGGAVSAESGDAALLFDECLFVRNAGGSVFAAYNGPEDQLTISRCTFHANEVLSPGGGTITISGEPGPGPITIANSIVAFSTGGPAIACLDATVPIISCTDMYGNAGGDWTVCVAGQLGTAGNIGEDPLFCGAAADNVAIYNNSPCAPAMAGSCGLIGAVGVECSSACPPDTMLSAGAQHRLLFSIFNERETEADYVYVVTGDSLLSFADEGDLNGFGSQVAGLESVPALSAVAVPIWLRVDPSAQIGSVMTTRFVKIRAASGDADTCYTGATITGVVSSVAEVDRRKPQLFPSYPNPFNPSTTVRYFLPSPAFVSLAIFDAQGRLVRRLVDATVGVGIHEIRWDGRDSAGTEASSGVYFVRLAADGRLVSRKIVLLK